MSAEPGPATREPPDGHAGRGGDGPDAGRPGARRVRFDRVPAGEYGYHVRQVDRFMARARTAHRALESGASRVSLGATEIRHATFDVVEGGYAAQQVDEVLDRLENAFARAERTQRIHTQGVDAWQQSLDERADLLMGRLERPDGERFRRPSRPLAQGYATASVDELCRLLRASLLGEDVDLTADDLRRAVFPTTYAAYGYDEAQVDAFLDEAIELYASLD